MEKISFIIATGKNELDYIHLLLDSLRDNLSSLEHEIIVFVDSDNQNTFEKLSYRKNIIKDIPNLTIIKNLDIQKLGIQINTNILISFATNEIISFLHSDMVISKNYDISILEEIEEDCILSATRIEPPLHGLSDKTFTNNFGLTPVEFRIKDFIEYAETVKSDKTLNYFFAPYSFYKSTWKKIGGYDTQFKLSREDSDLVQRCVWKNIKLKQTFKSNVYHFTCVSSRGPEWYNNNNKEAQERVHYQNLADIIELRNFIRKWGNFNHGEYKLKKYDVSLYIENTHNINEELISFIEPYFSKIFIHDTNIINSIIKKTQTNELNIINNIFKYTETEILRLKELKRFVNYEKIYKDKIPINFSCLLRIKSPEIITSEDEMNFIRNIHQIIEETEPGIYEYGNFILEIVDKICTSENNLDLEYSDYKNVLIQVV